MALNTFPRNNSRNKKSLEIENWDIGVARDDGCQDLHVMPACLGALLYKTPCRDSTL